MNRILYFAATVAVIVSIFSCKTGRQVENKDREYRDLSAMVLVEYLTQEDKAGIISFAEKLGGEIVQNYDSPKIVSFCFESEKKAKEAELKLREVGGVKSANRNRSIEICPPNYDKRPKAGN